jgi:hypothetical protein
MRKKKYPQLINLFLICCIPLCVYISACHKASPTPCYFQINPFVFTTDYATQGSASSKIVDVWVYVNNQNLGAYSLPCKIPIVLTDGTLPGGKSEIILTPGILNGGITTEHREYQFYSSQFDSVNLQPLQTYTFTPHAHYVDSLKFHLKEDFENGSSFDKLLGDTVLVRDNNPNQSLEGWYGKITLDPTHDTVEVVTSASMAWTLNSSNYPIVLEMNYKCDIPFVVGLLSNSAIGAVKYWHETFVAKSTWNKVYLDLTDAIGTLQGSTYQIIIRAGNTAGQITSAQNIYLDNIKLISR